MGKLKLSVQIYTADNIKKAISDYSAIAEIKLSKSKEYYICEFTACKYDEKETIMEFENYLIDLHNCYNG